jgi:transcription antitermination factor NusG
MLSGEMLEQIKRRALEIQADIEAKEGKFSAEIMPECSPQWHLIETWPNREMKAVKFLVDRHFGVFLPTFESKLGATRLIFPGHLFIFVWDIVKHWRRIRMCPGVGRVLMDQPEHPVVVPDKVIDFIQALQFGLSPSKLSKRQRMKRKYQQQICGDQDEETVILHCRSHWNDLEALAPAQRISLLHRALGLETLTPLRGAEATVPS